MNARQHNPGGGARWVTLIPMLFFSLLHNANSAPDSALKFESGETKTALLELYTSEGCSSCPPAEEWFSQLQRSPGLWKNFVPVAFHVDYWNHLGWRDEWSKPEFTARQEAYARRWASDSVYTPAIVLDGKERRLRDANPSAPKLTTGKLSLSSTGSSSWVAEFSPVGGDAGPYEIHAAILVCGAGVDVRAGENRGRRLVHDFVVATLKSISMSRRGDSWVGSVDLTFKSVAAGQSRAVAAWVTRAGDLEPVQATGGWIPKWPANN